MALTHAEVDAIAAALVQAEATLIAGYMRGRTIDDATIAGTTRAVEDLDRHYRHVVRDVERGKKD